MRGGGVARIAMSLCRAMMVWGVGEEVVGVFNYASDLFERSTIERWVGYFKAVLTGLVQRLDQPVSRLPMLGALERERILIEFNATQREYPQDQLIHELFEEQVQRSPQAIAVVYEG